MKPFLLVNIAIVLLIAFALFWTENPLALFGLFYLQNMPYEPATQEELEEQVAQKMGFIDTDAVG